MSGLAFRESIHHGLYLDSKDRSILLFMFVEYLRFLFILLNYIWQIVVIYMKQE